ncbi:NAPDH-dependent diflavin reductase [Neocucurbitaria cava]|uniref:NAPDH-dependent diflavin reductase n=1 Tax=Neocucurbitaria cava TaxID=798079 RepID=A0A9W8Y092_9PLEO|nr:NAPDH-dependent diflavin reductase [Neocucurbitaria cava]
MPTTQQARRALVLYGSETGNAQDVAEEMGRVAERLRFDTEVAELNAISLEPSQYVIEGESDEQHPEGIDGSFLPWSTSHLRHRLLEEYPLPEGVHPIPDDVLLDPKWVLDYADNESSVPPTSNVITPTLEPTSNSDTPDVPPTDLLNIPNGLAAHITSNERITPTTHWQDVRHLKLSLSGTHPYAPGDVLTLYPKNFPSDVNLFLSLMDWTSIADTPLHFHPSSPSSAPPPTTLPVPHLSQKSTVTLRQLLTNHLDILSIPRRSFFAQLAHYTPDPFHRDRLLEFTNPEYIDELYDYTTRPRRSILEVLQEFESVKIPWQRICSIIPTLRGRQFSIASAMNMKMNPSEDAADITAVRAGESERTEIELLIAIVKYKTVIKRIRQGVATRYIANLTPGQDITVTLSKGGLGVSEKEVGRPVVMVGPGTGVAPMRALIYQRKQWREKLGVEPGLRSDGEQVQDLLFFGCRNAEADYFFKDEWEALKKDEGVPLEVFAAFSRDQRQKVYVQDLIRQQSSLIFNSLSKQNGIIYICGSSGKMPQAIREALIEGFQEHGPMSREDAESYLAGMEKSGRYRQETW